MNQDDQKLLLPGDGLGVGLPDKVQGAQLN